MFDFLPDSGFTQLEMRVLLAVCEADPNQAGVALQFATAKVIKRDRTGHGVFTNFSTGDNVQPVDADGRILRGSQRLTLSHPDLAHGADIIVWVEAGICDCLEVVNFGSEPWPDSNDRFEFVP